MKPFLTLNLLLGAAAIATLLALRPRGTRSTVVIAGLAVGLLFGIAAGSALTGIFKTSRYSNIRPVVKYTLQTDDPSRRQLLIIGSSYTSLGVDSPLLERALGRHDVNVQVLDLAKHGNFMISQDYTLDYFLARAPKAPEYVFIEFGPEYYNDSGDMGPSYVDTGTAILDHDPSQFVARARSISTYPAQPLERAEKYWNLGTHTLFHVANFGLSSQLASDADVIPDHGFLPQNKARKPVQPDEIADLSQAAHAQSDPQPPRVYFIEAFRRSQVRRLKARGVKVVGFYQTAMAPIGMRDYAAQVCADLRDVPCITTGPALLARLHKTSYWFDPVHLARPGAEVYTGWLAERIAAVIGAPAEGKL